MPSKKQRSGTAGDAQTGDSGQGGLSPDRFDGRANPKAGTSATPLSKRDMPARIVRWNKTSP